VGRAARMIARGFRGLMMGCMTDLERENTVALRAMQALLGLVSGGIRGVSVELVADTVVLYVAVRQRTAELDEDLDDIVFKFDALLDELTSWEVKVHDGPPDLNWPGRSKRLVYLAKQ